MNKVKQGDFLTLNRDIIISYDHSQKSEKIYKGDKLQVVSISPNNPDFLRVRKPGVSDNIGLTIFDFNL